MMLQTIKSLISVLQSIGLGGGALYVSVVHMELEKKEANSGGEANSPSAGYELIRNTFTCLIVELEGSFASNSSYLRIGCNLIRNILNLMTSG